MKQFSLVVLIIIIISCMGHLDAKQNHKNTQVLYIHVNVCFQYATSRWGCFPLCEKNTLQMPE